MLFRSLQSCPTLCDPMDCSLPGSSVHGIFQARVLEWVAIAFSTRKTPWTAAFQAPLSMGFSRQEYWSGVPLALQVESLPAEPQGKPKHTGVGSLSLLQGIFLIYTMKYCSTIKNETMLFAATMDGPRDYHRRRQWHPTPVLLPGRSHGWRSLVGCSPWGC